MVAASWVILSVVYLVLTQKKAHELGTFWLLMPSAAWVGSNVIKQGLGALIISNTPREYVLDGEFGQYITTWNTINVTSGWWLLLTFFVGGMAFVLRSFWQKGRNRFKKSLRWKDTLGHLREARKDALYWITLVSVFYFFLEVIVSFVTGSMDRGSEYVKWATSDFRPTAAFIALSRLKMISFALIPRNWKVSSRIERCIYVAGIVVVLGFGVISGGRGASIYPGIGIAVGAILFSENISRRRLVVGLISIGAVLLLFVPYLAAYRDTEVFQGSKSQEVRSRAQILVGGVSKERFTYRQMALGRELYACSDGYLLEPHDKSVVNVGLSDLQLGDLWRLVVPRVIGDRQFLKFDGSVVAQKAMGVDVPGWYPCISLPADLWRRSGVFGIVIGGIGLGVVLGILDIVWFEMLRSRWEIWKGLGVLLPVSLLQSNLNSGLREVFWQLIWDMPKYLVTFVAIGLVSSLVSRIFSKGIKL